MKRSIILICSLFLQSHLLLAIHITETDSATRQEKDVALFFAVDHYPDADWPPLRNPVKDVRALAEVLERAYDFETHVYENLTKRDWGNWGGL